MKTQLYLSIIITAFIIFIPCILKSQNWSNHPTGTSDVLLSVWFEDANTGWVAGINGTIFHSNDGGNSWSPQTSGTTDHLLNFSFTDQQTGWIAGHNGTILHTNDGGSTWNSQASGTTNSLIGVHFINADTGWVAGWDGTVLHTTDGGNNWNSQSLPTTNSMTSVHFVNANDGWIVGVNGDIYHTNDGGSNWSSQTSGTTENLLKVFFINENTGWISGEGGTVLHTSDGGSNWNNQTTNITDNLRSVWFINSSTGWGAGGNGRIIRTTDGGSNWSVDSTGTTDDLNSVHFNNAADGWAAGEGGLVLKHSIVGPYATIAGSAQVCKSDTGKVYSSTQGSDNYNWDIINGAITSGQGSHEITVNWGTADTGYVTLTETVNSQEDHDTFMVIINPYPEPDITGDAEVCGNDQGILYSVNDGADNYQWHISGGSIVSGSGTHEVTVNWGNNGNGELIVAETTNGCTGTDTLNINIKSTPEPVIAGQTTICTPDSNYVYTVDTGADSYLWTVGNGSVISGSGTNEVIINFDSSGYVTVEKTTANCTGYDSIQISIPGEITPEITGADTVCQGDTNVTYNTIPDADDYEWSVHGGSIISGQNTPEINVNWNFPDSSRVILKKTINGCSVRDTLPVTVQAAPQPVISGPDATCAGEQLTSYSVDTGAENYNWTVTNGNIVSGQGTHNIDIEWINPGMAEVILEKTVDGCQGSDTLHVNVQPVPQPVISGPDAVCSGEQLISYSVDTGAENYNWTVTNGNIVSGQGTHSIDIEWERDITGTLIVSVTDNGCPGIDSMNITISSPVASAVTGPEEVIRHTSSHIYYTSLIQGHDPSWDVIGGSIEEDHGDSITVSWGAKGNGKILLTQTDTTTDARCDTTIALNVIVKELHDPKINGTTEVCNSSSDETYFADTSASYTYEWGINGGEITDELYDEIQVHWDTTGTASITLKQTHSISGFDTTYVLPVEILELPESSFNLNINPDIAGIEPRPADSTHLSYEWDFGDGNQSQDMHPQHTYNENGEYEVMLTVTHQNGCRDSSAQMADINMVNLTFSEKRDTEVKVYPNPFTYKAHVAFSLKQQQNISGVLYSVSGRRIAHIEEGVKQRGEHELIINAHELGLRSGIYILQLHINETPVHLRIEYAGGRMQ